MTDGLVVKPAIYIFHSCKPSTYLRVCTVHACFFSGIHVCDSSVIGTTKSVRAHPSHVCDSFALHQFSLCCCHCAINNLLFSLGFTGGDTTYVLLSMWPAALQVETLSNIWILDHLQTFWRDITARMNNINDGSVAFKCHTSDLSCTISRAQYKQGCSHY